MLLIDAPNHVKAEREKISNNPNCLVTLLDVESALGHQSLSHLVIVPHSRGTVKFMQRDGQQGVGKGEQHSLRLRTPEFFPGFDTNQLP